MSDYPSAYKKYSILFFSFILIFSYFLFSCKDSEPRILTSNGYVIFDYQDQENFPESRLAFFVETISDARRVEKLKVFNRNTGFQWQTDEVQTFSFERKQWAGFFNFALPVNQNVPTGYYDVTFFDGENRECSSSCSISFPEGLPESTFSQMIEIVNENKKNQIAVFDKDDVLLYWGDKKNVWTSDGKIFSSLKDSYYFRECFLLNGSNAICLFPPVYKNSIEEENLDIENNENINN